MRTVVLSHRAVEILIAFDQGTKWEGTERPGAKMVQFYVPEASDQPRSLTDPTGKPFLYYKPYGADAAIIRSLDSKRLIELGGEAGEFGGWITEEGMLALQDIFFPCQCTKAECLNPPKYRRKA